MEEVDAISNEKKGAKQKEAVKSLKTKIIQRLRNYGEDVETEKVMNGTFICPEILSKATLGVIGACKQPTNTHNIPEKMILDHGIEPQ